MLPDDNVSPLPNVKVLNELNEPPGVSVPPSCTVAGPLMTPVPASTPPAPIVTALPEAKDPLTCKSPLLTVVEPV